jgi:RNA polymerase sigma-70 factor (ECF subfamily)
LVTATTGTLPSARDAHAHQRDLVLAAAAHDARAFGELYSQYSRKVYNLILRSVRNAETAEDVAQEVWIKVYRDLPKLRDPLAFPAWLYQTASKTCVDAARKRTRLPQTAELSDEIPTSADDPEAAALGGHDAQLTREALASLPAHQHLALFLREADDRSYREISDVIGISETAVGLCLMRARRSFAKTYSRLEQASRQERCEQMQPNLARVFDGEATPVQRKAVEGHLTSCAACRDDARLMREGSKRYAMLALAPVPAALNAKVFAALGLGAAGGAGAAAGLVGSILGKVKLALLALLAGAGVTTGAVLVPTTRPMVANAVASVRDAPGVSYVADRIAGGGSGITRSNGSAVNPARILVQPRAGAGVAAEATPVPGVSEAVPTQVASLPDTVATVVAPVTNGVPTVVAPLLPSIVPTVEALPGDVLPDVPLPALPPIIPTVIVGGVNLP